MKRWSRLGHKFAAPGTGLLQSHAMLPTPLILEDRVRVFFSSCDTDMRGRIFSVDLEPAPPYRVITTNIKPALDLGAAGCFDQDGVNPTQVFMHRGVLTMLYVGWQRVDATTPYRLFTGMAVSDDGLFFRRVSEQPFLGPTREDTLFRTGAFMRPHGDGWMVIYIGGGEFVDGANGKKLPNYSLKMMTSSDGADWAGPETILLKPDRERSEIGFGRPALFSTADAGELLFISVRTPLGYEQLAGPFAANAIDRNQLTAILPPHDRGPWENEMTCFGTPCLVGGSELLFYNGNGFGRSGFGVAISDGA